MPRTPTMLMLLALAGPTWAQTDALYYTDTGTDTLHIVQGGADAPIALPVGSIDEVAIAVAGDVRTLGGRTDGTRQYDLAGAYTGPSFARPAIAADFHDGTTNGVHNFATASDGWVYRFDRDWQNPTPLFQPVSGGWGITYDHANATLWISNGFSTVEQYSMTGGTPLSSFTLLPGTFTENAIAWEPSTDTIWVIENFASLTGLYTAQQYDKTGAPMASVPLLGGIDPTGGAEFDMGPIPAPGTLALLALAAGAARRRRADADCSRLGCEISRHSTD